MSPLPTTQAVALATTTAMAVSGTLIILALCLHYHKTPPGKSRFLYSWITSSISRTEEVPNEGNRSRREQHRRKKNKRVSFADGVTVMDPAEQGRRRGIITNRTDQNSCSRPNPSSATTAAAASEGKVNRGMPENRKALYDGILRDRIIQRVAYSY